MYTLHLPKTSESLVSTLCTEIEYIRNRTNNIKQSLKSCSNNQVYKRLLAELDSHRDRSLTIFSLSKSLILNNKKNLSVVFLIEICKRAINHHQEISR